MIFILCSLKPSATAVCLLSKERHQVGKLVVHLFLCHHPRRALCPRKDRRLLTHPTNVLGDHLPTSLHFTHCFLSFFPFQLINQLNQYVYRRRIHPHHNWSWSIANCQKQWHFWRLTGLLCQCQRLENLHRRVSRRFNCKESSKPSPHKCRKLSYQACISRIRSSHQGGYNDSYLRSVTD